MNRFRMNSVRFALTAVAICGLSVSCDKHEPEPAPDPDGGNPQVLQNQIQYNGGALADIKSAIYTADDDDTYTFYFSPEAGITKVSAMEATDDYLLVAVRNPDGEIDTALDKFSIRYKGLSVTYGQMDGVKRLSLSADFDAESKTLALALDMEFKAAEGEETGAVLKAGYSNTVTKAEHEGPADLENQYEVDGSEIKALASAVGQRNRAESTVTWYLYETAGQTEADAETSAIVITLTGGLETARSLDLSGEDAANVKITCGEITNGEGTTGTLNLDAGKKSGEDWLELSLDMKNADGKVLRADLVTLYTPAYIATNKIKVTPAVEDAETTEAALGKVFKYEYENASSLMFGTVQNPTDASSLKAEGGYAMRVNMTTGDYTDGSTDEFDLTTNRVGVYLYDYIQNKELVSGDENSQASNATGTVFKDLQGENLYLYVNITYSDGTVAEAEWLGPVTVAENDAHLSVSEPSED